MKFISEGAPTSVVEILLPCFQWLYTNYRHPQGFPSERSSHTWENKICRPQFVCFVYVVGTAMRISEILEGMVGLQRSETWRWWFWGSISRRVPFFLACNTSGGSKYREIITKTFFKSLGLLIFYGLRLYNEMRLGTEQNTSWGPFKPFKNLTRFIGWSSSLEKSFKWSLRDINNNLYIAICLVSC